MITCIFSNDNFADVPISTFEKNGFSFHFVSENICDLFTHFFIWMCDCSRIKDSDHGSVTVNQNNESSEELAWHVKCDAIQIYE